MNRRSFLKTIAQGAAGLGLLSCQKSAQTKPNILFIVTDDQGPWTLSAEGYPNTHTPEIDKIVKQGAILKNAFTVGAVCSPSRAALISSRYPSELGINNFINTERKIGLDPKVVTWPEVLQSHGYQTALVGKWHLGESHAKYLPTNHGYDRFSGFLHGGMTSKSPRVQVEGEWKVFDGEYTPDVLTDLAIDYIKEFKQKPFALSLHYWAPHANSREKVSEFYPDMEDRSWLPLKEEDLSYWQDHEIRFPDPDFPNLDEKRLTRMMREYYASVHSVDRNVGRIMRFLDEQDLADNTIVLFTSDHGYMMGHHGLWHKGNGRWVTKGEKDPYGIYEGNRKNLYDLSIRVPFVVRWPGKIPAGLEVDENISFLDWYPTILAMAGTKQPSGVKIHGKNALPLLQGKDMEWNNDLYAEYLSLRTFRTPDWKIVIDFEDETKNELYHLAEDPGETENLFGSDRPDAVKKKAELKAQLLAKMKEIDDPLLQDQSNIHI
ncbi:sulfatase-like hydrolase/transferase [candidate division KSB1 bacterium]|nr:sulfatase-like hydrolase/transferase [candidate division KSB1 bacterium]